MPKLFAHQAQGVALTVAAKGNFALFWEPGCGKTLATLEIFKVLRRARPDLRLLVVCPLSLINSAWGEDIAKFTSFSFAPLRKVEKTPPDIVAINYESLISKKILPGVINAVRRDPWMCVLDESSRLKNHKSITAQTLLTLAPYFRHRLILSGTPMPNSELELWAQIKFIGGNLPDSFYAFRNTYFCLQRNGQTQAFPRFATKDALRQLLTTGWKYGLQPHMRKELMQRIAPKTHWVKKAEALDLPEKVDQVREVTLGAEEKKAYNDMKRHLCVELQDATITASVALAKIMKLRQITAGFGYDAQGVTHPIGNSKLNELDALLDELGNQPVIILSLIHI